MVRTRTRERAPNIDLLATNPLIKVFFLNIFSLLRVYRRRNDPNLDLLNLSSDDSAKATGQKLDRAWKKVFENKSSSPTLTRVLYEAFGSTYMKLGIWRVLWIIFMYLSAYVFFKLIVGYVAEAPPQYHKSTGFHVSISQVGAHIVAVGILISCILSSICSHQMKAECTRIGIQVRASLMVMIYRKSLRLHSVSGEMGDIVTLIGDHCNSIAEAFVNFHFLWSTSVEILVVIALSFVELKLAALPLLIILIILFPIQYFLAQYAANLSKRKTKITSERVHLTSEILTAIKLVKFYAWETYFLNRISKVRQKEMRELKLQFLTKSFLLAIVFGTPVLATIASLQTYGLIYPDEILSGELIFTILSIFNTLRYPLLMLPNAIQTTRAATSSLQIIEDFLTKPEVVPLLLSADSPPEPGLKLLIRNANFSWKTNSKPTLQDINIEIIKGRICAIVGDVGAGKSSLLNALMGQMFQQSGKMELFGSMSYVPNEPWILSATVRDNIVFGSKFDIERYRQVVKVCALNRDFRNLVNGDRTEIGERGINLTLGQRHRISLARAAYSNTDIIFIDESLSVMDSRVSKHIFKEVLQEFLQDRAIVFVTNQLQYLPKCNHIIVMKSGKIIEQGSYEELMANDVDLAALVGESVEIEDPNKIDDLALDDEFFYNTVSETNTNPTLNANEQNESSSESGNQNIKIVINSVPDRPRASFIENDQNSINPTVTFSRTNTIERSSAQNNQAANDLTISRMIERVNHLPSEQAVSTIIDRHQLSVLGGAGLAMNINNTQAENNALARALERNQMTIHSIQVQEGFEDSSEEPIDKSKLLKTLYLAFFKEGTGVWITSICFIFFFIVHIFRLYNDYWLEVVSNSESTAKDVNGYLNIYSYIGVAFIVGVILRGLFFTAVMVKKGLSFHKNMLEPILSAPISYFEYTPLSKILTSFARHLTLVDEHMFDSIFLALQFFPLVIGTFLLCVIVVPFLAIPGVILLSICLFLIWYVKAAEDKIQSSEVNSRSPMFSHLAATLEGLQSIRVYRIQARFDAFNLIKIDASNKALYALTLVKCWLALYIDIVASVLIYLSVLLVLIQEPNNISLTEGLVGLALSNAMQILLFGQITVQAIQDSMGSIWSIDQLIHFRTSITPEGQQDSNDYEPPTDWPTQGRISFQNVMLRYHRYGVAVLKNVSFTIEGKEKVAIVGTTGSGKTTLLTSLLRLVEAGEGSICIDDVDISSISLEALRRSIAVIPQDPVLFYGTVRSNLDPYSHCSEEEMWNALKSVHLSEKVKEMPLQLDTPIVENGTIFTFAQRQLFCIARAILLKCKILILDEATSAVDLHTEHMIQETIDNNFQNYTILFVGHRLNSIIEADKILVMDQGQVVEYDPPDVLLSNPDGHFYSMVLQNGEDVVQSLHSQAVAKAEARFKRRQSDILERHTSVDRNTVSDSHQITLKTLASQISHSQSTHSSVKIKDMPRSLEGVFQNLATTSSHSLNNQDESPTSSSTPLANSKKSSTDITKQQ